MIFPLNKKIIKLNNSENNYLKSYVDITEIPLLPHPGAFSKMRKYHQHEGVDLYCEENDEVRSIEDGIVIKIKQFTGKNVGSEWWNDTWCIMIKGKSGVFNYGEIIPNLNIKEGMSVSEGQIIGNVTKVLKNNKGRPMVMLHLELYTENTLDSNDCWNLNIKKPDNLIDPTNILIKISNVENK